MTDDIFGSITPGHIVADKALDVLKAWMPTYLKEMSLQWGGPLLPAPRSWRVRPSGEKWPEDQMPSVLGVSAGLDGEPPRMEGDGNITATFRIGIIVFCHGREEDSARRNASVYAAAARTILMQRPKLSDSIRVMTWDAESYDDGPIDATRSLGVAVIEFLVEAEGVMNRRRGPAVADPPSTVTLPGSNWPKVEDTELVVTHKEG